MPLLEQRRIRLFIKRDDLIHPEISGNKWRKLKYNIKEAKAKGYHNLATFGGAYSNHIAATAAAGKHFNFSTIGIIRGERVEPLNPTLSYAEQQGMHLHFVDRTTYRVADREQLANQIAEKPFYYLPEGGTNELALKGCQEIIHEVQHQILDTNVNYYVVACGTGGTVAGMIQGVTNDAIVLGFSALKGDFLEGEVKTLLKDRKYHNWSINDDFHFGGYAKTTPSLINFINSFQENYDVLLDPIYTGKAMFGLLQLIEKEVVKSNTTIVFVHTGGLQGILGFNERSVLKIKME